MYLLIQLVFGAYIFFAVVIALMGTILWIGEGIGNFLEETVTLFKTGKILNFISQTAATLSIILVIIILLNK